MRSAHPKHLLSFLALPLVALTAFLAAQSSNPIRGDVNNDGQVTTVDALAVMSHVVGKPLPQGYTITPNGDANGDGQITAADALVILSFVVGKDVSQFPVGKGVITLSLSPSSATVARGETRQLSASVTGSSNTGVTWRSSAEAVATVSASGLVTGVAPGEATITAISQADTLARATAKITVTQAAAAGLTIVSGNAQPPTTVGTQLPNALVVKVTDAQGNAVSGASVTWAVTTGGGSITQTSTTDANGQATAIWTLGPTAGAQTATATVGNQTVTFSATATAAAPAKLEKAGGDAQSGAAGSALADSLAVRVTDQFNNPIPGVSITWNVTGGGGNISPPTSTTNAQGIAKAQWTLGATAGQNTATASANGLETVTFTATGGSGAAGKLVKVSGDTARATVGTVLPNPLVVRVLDANNNPVSGVSVAWKTVGQSGRITPQTTVSDAEGLAQATWTLDTIAGGDTARAVIASDSVTFTATALPGAVTSLIVSPDSATVKVDSTTQLTATPRDQYGNPVSGQPVIWSNPNDSIATVNATGVVRGVRPGTARIVATVGSSSGSATITVTAGLEAPTNLTATGSAFSLPISLSWTDNSTNESEFRIERKSSTGEYAQIARVEANVTQYRDSLTQGGTYTYRVRACNAAGACSTYSNEASAVSGTRATVSPASNITATSAVLSGCVQGGGFGSASFSYGTSRDTLRNRTTSQRIGQVTCITSMIEGLAGNTTYYFRLDYTNNPVTSGNSTSSEILEFRTLPPVAPSASTHPATDVNATRAVLNASVNPNGAATQAYFEWSTSSTLSTFTATSPKSIPAFVGSSQVPLVADTLTALGAGTTYYFRVVATNAAGTTRGDIRSFTTQAAAVAPSVTTGAATNVTTTTATVNGTVDPNGTATQAFFEVGTSSDLSGATSSPAQTLSGTTSQALSLALTGLAPSATYYFRVVATNAAGTTRGSIQSFTTQAAGP